MRLLRGAGKQRGDRGAVLVAGFRQGGVGQADDFDLAAGEGGMIGIDRGVDRGRS